MNMQIESSIQLAIKENKTFSQWWKSVNGLFPRCGVAGRDEMVRFSQSYWRTMNGKFCELKGS